MKTTDIIDNLSTIDLWTVDALAAMLVALSVTLLLLPAVIRYSNRKNFFDTIAPRKVHTIPVSRLGGVIFLPAIIFAISLVTGVTMFIIPDGLDLPQGIELSRQISKGAMCMGALSLIYLVGIVDDISGLSFKQKLATQLAASGMVAASGIAITDLQGFLGIGALPGWASIILTIMVMLLIINAINFIDGIDGLAATLSLSALAIYSIILYNHGYYISLALTCTAIGTIGAFFFFNVFGSVERNTKIFMGDSGSLTIGMLLSILAVELCNIPAGAESTSSLIVAISPLVVPSLDALRVVFLRIRQGRSPFLADRSHIHHKLLAVGMSQHAALLVLIAVSMAITTLNLLLSPAFADITIILIDITIWSTFTYAIHTRQLQISNAQVAQPSDSNNK